MKLLPILAAGLLLIPFSSASYITINSQLPEIFTNENSTPVKLTISNTGDEGAFSVQTSFKTPDGINFPTLFEAKMDPDSRVDNFFNMNMTAELKPGKYPIVTITEYSDANNYPFSAISYTFLVYNHRTSSDVNGLIDDVQIPKGGKSGTKLKIVNSGPSEKDVKITLFLPKELFTSSYTENVTLHPSEQKSIGIEISSLSALPGSAYTILASIEYDDSGLHYSSFARGLATISKNDGLFSNSITAVSIFILSALILLKNRKPKRK
ncbi:MAG: hypothetical protein HYT71_00200 [Candidatus Aenigmarchaeota archaeon]|nr:hypothetical protein [Candidatus Aenigmarchaeota archaeon]